MPDDFYRHLREAASGNAPHVDVDDVQYRSIIARCRFLRTVKAEQAHRWIDAMWLTCERIIDEVQPDMIVGSLIDSYVQDICDRVARQRGIRYAGYLTTMVAGYSRLTTRGELWEHRTVESDETARVLEMMGQRNYVPQYAALNPKAGRFSRHAKAFVTKYLKQQLKYGYYALAKVAARDPHNLYYNVHLGRGGMICRKPSYLTVDKYTQQDWRDQLEAARQRGATIVYLPLQAVLGELQRGELVPLNLACSDFDHRFIYAIARSGQHRSPACAAFISQILPAFAEGERMDAELLAQLRTAQV